MCGRYTSTTSPADLAAYFGADEVVAPDLGRRWNVAPTDEVYGVADGRDDVRRIGAFRWGLVPFWAEDPRIGARMVNARAETLLDKPAFRDAFERRRCIVPADGFYEWQPVPGRRRKQAWHIRPAGGGVFAFAGLWSSWRPATDAGPPDGGGGRLVSCTIVTTTANGVVRPIHDRMPAVLPRDAWDAWLDPANRATGELAALLGPAPDEAVEVVPVGPAVGDVRNDGPELVTPVDPVADAGP